VAERESLQLGEGGDAVVRSGRKQLLLAGLARAHADGEDSRRASGEHVCGAVAHEEGVFGGHLHMHQGREDQHRSRLHFVHAEAMAASEDSSDVASHPVDAQGTPKGRGGIVRDDQNSETAAP
jgi:hypothetical protein